mgnify:CR=1 FL=1
MNLLIVTACPNGQVTSVLCSRLLQAAAERLGWQTCVEVHDSRAIGAPLSEAQIAAADWVLVVKTGELSLARFAGKRLVQAAPAEALADPQRFAETYAALARNARQSVQAVCPWLDGLYVNTAHGSRGMISAPLSGELLAAWLDDEPLPLPREVAEACHPNRFLLRKLIRGT